MAVYLGDTQVGVVVSVIDEHKLNVDYAKQQDLLAHIDGTSTTGADYDDLEIARLDAILTNLTEGSNG